MGFHSRDWSTQAEKCWLAWHDRREYGKVNRWRFQNAVALLDRLYLGGTDVARSVWNFCQLPKTLTTKGTYLYPVMDLDVRVCRIEV